MKKRSGKNTLELIKLRLMLLRIWFMKNLMTFLKVAVAIVFVLMLFGQINENTPVLGFLIYPILKPLIDSINEIIATRDAGSFMGFASAALSILITISVFTIKLKSISQNDIKNKELKVAMIKAGLYFNENGKLVKKVEKATGIDINGDGVVDENDIVKSEGFFKGISRAVSEFITVVTTDISENETADEKINDAAKNIDATETKEALDEIDNIVISSTLDKAAEIVNKTFDKTIETAEKKDLENDGENATKNIRKENSFINMIRSVFLGFINYVKSIFIKSKDSANKEDGEKNMTEKEPIIKNEESDTVVTKEETNIQPEEIVVEQDKSVVVENIEPKDTKVEETKSDNDIRATIMRKYM